MNPTETTAPTFSSALSVGKSSVLPTSFLTTLGSLKNQYPPFSRQTVINYGEKTEKQKIRSHFKV